jgi:hypothetical protein
MDLSESNEVPRLQWVYEIWCEEAIQVDEEWSAKYRTPEKEREFYLNEDVIAISKFTRDIVREAFRASLWVKQAVVFAEGLEFKRTQRTYQSHQIQLQKVLDTEAKQDRQGDRPTSQVPKGKKNASLSNTFDFTSSNRGHRPRTRPTPTESRKLCPSCGGIEDGCRCSR